MGCKKGKCHRQALLAQFCYEHQKLECCMRKIRKNAEELCKILDSMPPKKEKETTASGWRSYSFITNTENWKDVWKKSGKTPQNSADFLTPCRRKKGKKKKNKIF